MHTMGTSFVGKVRGVRQIAEAQIGDGVTDMLEFKAQVSRHEATKKANRIQTCQHLADWQFANRFERNRPVLLLPGSWWSRQNEPGFEIAGLWQKPTRRVRCIEQCTQCRVVKELDKDFRKMQLGRGGKCKACKGGGQKMKVKLLQPLIEMIFTNADLRYACRLDDKQGGDAIVTMKRVREAIAFNAESADESTWLWLTLEQMGFSLRQTSGGEDVGRAGDLDSSQRTCDHLAAYHLAPAITDFILHEDWEYCNNELEQTLSCCRVNGIMISSPRGNTQHRMIVHVSSATQSTKKDRSSCAEACSGKRPRCQQLRMTLASFVSKKRH